MRLAAFILALNLLGGSADPTRGWLIALVVVSGIAAVRPRIWNPLHMRPAVDLRLATFVIAVLLLAGAIDPTRDWLIGLTVIAGLAAFMPRLISFDLFDHRRNDSTRHRSWSWICDNDGRTHDAASRSDRAWARWERRMERRAGRWGDDWS